jgi:hypothetical protein
MSTRRSVVGPRQKQVASVPLCHPLLEKIEPRTELPDISRAHITVIAHTVNTLPLKIILCSTCPPVIISAAVDLLLFHLWH